MRMFSFLLKTWDECEKKLEINLCNQTFLFANGFRYIVNSFVRGLVFRIAAPEEITIKSHFHFFHILLKDFLQSMFQHYLLCPQLNNCRIFSLIFHCWCFRNLAPRQLFSGHSYHGMCWSWFQLNPAIKLLAVCTSVLVSCPCVDPSMAQEDFQVKTIHFLCFTLILIHRAQFSFLLTFPGVSIPGPGRFIIVSSS